MRKAKVLIFDIESGGVNALKPDLGFVFCFGYKWLGEKKTYCLRLDQYDGYKKKGYCDKKLLKAAYNVIEEADLLVTHYGSEFDKKFLNGRIALNGLSPLPFTKMVDTCKLAWKYFNFSSARLKNLARHLKVKHQKMDSDFPGWWLAALRGHIPSLIDMATYCKADVDCLEEVYLKLRTFEENAVRLFTDKDPATICGICGGRQQKRGFIHVGNNRYQRYRCSSCAKWSRSTRKYANKA